MNQNKAYVSYGEQRHIAMLGHKRIPSREGGIEVVVEELSTRLVVCGHKVTCYNRRGHHVSGKEYDVPKIKEYKGVEIKDVFTINRKGLAALTSSILGSICAALGKYDIVHFHAEGPAFMCWLPKLFGKKIVVTIHGLDWKRAKWSGIAAAYIMWGERNAVKYADEIIVLSENVKKYFKETYNRDTIFIPNGINKADKYEAKLIKEKWNLEKDEYILYLGRLVPEKGAHFLVEAYKELNPKKKLVIAGGCSDTVQYINGLIKQAEGNEKIIFTGFVEGRMLEELYSNAYIYCLPSELEGMPLSLLEAMNYGNCCVVSNIPECEQVVGDKAVVFDIKDIKDLQNKLKFLCENPDVVRKYKEEASEYISQKYNWDDVIEKTLAVYLRE